MKLGYSVESKWLPDSLTLIVHFLHLKKGERETAEELIISNTIVCPPSDPMNLQNSRWESVGDCVFYYVLDRVMVEAISERFRQTKVPQKNLGRGFLFRNHGNQTRSLHKFFPFFDLVKSGACINVPIFPYQRYSRPSSHVASSPGLALAETPSTICWPPERGESPTRNDEEQSVHLQPPPSFFPSVHEHIIHTLQS